jgi:hypothetical protein
MEKKKIVLPELSFTRSELTWGCICTPKNQTHTINKDGEPLDLASSPKQASKCANMGDTEIKKL